MWKSSQVNFSCSVCGVQTSASPNMNTLERRFIEEIEVVIERDLDTVLHV